jgi:hypothetical protein
VLAAGESTIDTIEEWCNCAGTDFAAMRIHSEPQASCNRPTALSPQQKRGAEVSEAIPSGAESEPILRAGERILATPSHEINDDRMVPMTAVPEPLSPHRPTRLPAGAHAEAAAGPRAGRWGRVAPHVCLAAGCFALVVAVLLPLFVYPRVAVLPADPQQGQRLVASDATVLVPDATSPTGARTLHDVGVTVDNYISGASTGSSGNSVVWQIATKFNVDGHGLLNARVEQISLNRHTGQPTNCCGDRLVTSEDDTSGQLLTHSGYLTLPFDVQKQSYKLWDINLQHSKTADYIGEDTVSGINTYKFRAVVPPQKVGTMDLPGGFFGLKVPSVTADSMYADQQTYWIEPNTGDVVRLEDTISQQYTYAGKSITAFAASLKTPDPAADRLSRDKQGALLLPVLRSRASWLLVPIGLILLALGVYLLVRRRGTVAAQRTS